MFCENFVPAEVVAAHHNAKAVWRSEQEELYWCVVIVRSSLLNISMESRADTENFNLVSRATGELIIENFRISVIGQNSQQICKRVKRHCNTIQHTATHCNPTYEKVICPHACTHTPSHA